MSRLPIAAALATALCLAGCPKRVTRVMEENAIIEHDLGLEALKAGNPQAALAHLTRAVDLWPSFAEGHFALGLTYQSFKKPELAEKSYQRALEIKKDYSDAKVNLATIYLEQARYDEAIKLCDEALGDMLYRTPYLAQNNRGWALYKKGEVDQAIDSLKEAVTIEPKFCQGYRNLGLLHDEQGKTDDACRYFGKYREACPQVADAHFREGVCLAKQGKADEARQRLQECEQKATGELKDDCQSLLQRLQ